MEQRVDLSSSTPSHDTSQERLAQDLVRHYSQELPLFANSLHSPPLVEHLKLQVRMNTKQKSRAVELRTSQHTIDVGALQKGEDFIRAFSLGFDVDGEHLCNISAGRTLTQISRFYRAFAAGRSVQVF